MTEQLVELAEQNAEVSFDLKKGETILIGRSPDRKSPNQILVPDINVSNKHIELMAHPEGVVAKDQKSTNGTAVDGEWLRPGIPFALRNGSIILLGKNGTAFLKVLIEAREDQTQSVRVIRTSPKVETEVESEGSTSAVAKWIAKSRDAEPGYCLICKSNFHDKNNDTCPTDGIALRRSKEPPPGEVTIAGDYLLQKWVGTGSLTEVYKAEHVRTQKPFAVKVFRYGVARDTEAAFIVQSCKQWAGLKHPAISVIEHWGWISNNELYLIMEFFDCSSLAQIVRDEGPLSPQDAMKIFNPIFDALQYAHEQGAFHSNLKLSKIFVTNHKTNPIVKISDFGIVDKLVRSVGWINATLKTKDKVGDPMTLSPEFWQGEETTSASYVYVVGCALFHALTGTPVFSSKRTMETVAAHIYKEPPSIPVDSLISAPVREVLARCLKKQPAERFQTLGELQNALTAAVNS